MSYKQKVFTRSAEETEEFGRFFGQYLQKGDVVCLIGDLGTGKTVLARGICSALGCAKEVSSPTFTIINEYQGKFPVYHFDFYRLKDESEIYDLGYEEYFYDDGVCLIEWAERARNLLPDRRIEFHLSAIFEPGKENMRQIEIYIPHFDELKARWIKELSKFEEKSYNQPPEF